ncbi:TonB-dependent receptor plug domain-containing protein [Marinilabiliaceae bacterium ANBcel2]|nr:TonB-dependent receptor plug domain-containing protein [Marinilabiliaceae bacterium ANBcel2]
MIKVFKNRYIPTILLICSFALCTEILKGENSSGITIEGRVTDIYDDPVINAHIISSNQDGDVSNHKGEFLFSVKSVPVTLNITALGFKKRTITVDKDDGDNNYQVSNDNKIVLNIVMEQKDHLIDQVEIKGRRQVSEHSQTIDISHVRTLPSAAGASVEGLVRSQMGVASNNELSSQYRVRGGNFDENLVYVNGQEVYRPFLLHSGQQEGLSFVNPDLVETVEFSAGGFSSSYGDKMSSVLDIEYKKPSQNAGGFSAGMLGGDAHAMGTSKDGKLTWITGARYKTNRYLLGSLDEKGDYRPDFTDIQSYITYNYSSRLSFEFLGYYSLNRYQFIPETRETTFGTYSDVKQLTIFFAGKEKDRFETGYGSITADWNFSDNANYRLTLSGFRTVEEETYDIAGAYWLQELEDPTGESDDFNQIGVGEYIQHARNDLFATVNTIDLKGRYDLPLGITEWGAQYRHEKFNDKIEEWEMIDSAGYSIPRSNDYLELARSRHSSNSISNNRLSGHLKNRTSWNIGTGHLITDIGVRGTYFSLNNETNVSPRLLFTWLPGRESDYRIRLSGGYYYQPPFFKEMRLPDGSINENIKAQKSLQIVSGIDYYFNVGSRPFKFTTEAYYKKLSNLISYNVDNVRIVYSGKNDADGYAAGIDFKINGDLVPGEESWATLSLMKSEERLKDNSYTDHEKDGAPGYIPRPSDQRLNFSMFIQDHLPLNPDFKAHLSFHYGTGLPFGPPESPRYEAIHRMPSYRRVDIGFSYDLMNYDSFTSLFNFAKGASIGLEIFNLPDIDNTISYYWVTDIENRQYAVPNYLTSRRINLSFSMNF